MTRPPNLTAAQLTALERFSARHGFMWKTTLRTLWKWKPAARNADTRLLLALRRSHGRAWLKAFRFRQHSPCVRRQIEARPNL